jgi:hypothetical protein
MSEINLEYNGFSFNIIYHYSPGNLSQRPSWTEPPEGPTVEIVIIYISPRGTDFPRSVLGMNKDPVFDFICQEIPKFFEFIEEEIIKLEGERK